MGANCAAVPVKIGHIFLRITIHRLKEHWEHSWPNSTHAECMKFPILFYSSLIQEVDVIHSNQMGKQELRIIKSCAKVHWAVTKTLSQGSDISSLTPVSAAQSLCQLTLSHSEAFWASRKSAFWEEDVALLRAKIRLCKEPAVLCSQILGTFLLHILDWFLLVFWSWHYINLRSFHYQIASIPREWMWN